ncbi:hypothetical protein ACL03H_07815 [Saccharopolyspora sp. MS10]|uniref:hypothetical protein n=1 Tax=Saccharopolyspora sp. MS10 TaxID=3385973 RepID=UPI00399F8029
MDIRPVIARLAVEVRLVARQPEVFARLVATAVGRCRRARAITLSMLAHAWLAVSRSLAVKGESVSANQA